MSLHHAVLGLILGLGVVVPFGVAAQDGPADTTGVRLPEQLPSGPIYPLLFDDFDYPVAIAYSQRERTGPDGSLFGSNDWWVGLPGDTLTLRRSRAWYADNWLEGPGNTNKWWRGGAYQLSTTRRPGEVVFRAEGPLSRSDGRGMDIRSGFVARTGTWLARVRLPDFDGLRYHGGDDDDPLSMFPAFWTHSSVATETREDYTFGNHAISWYEWNFEFNNWVAPGWPYGLPACPDGRRPRRSPAECVRPGGGAIGTGVLWALGGLYGEPTRWSAYSENPILGETAPQNCFVMNERGVVIEDPARCFDIATGAAFGGQEGALPTYVYLQAVVTPETTRFGIFVRDEDAEGRPGDFRDDFELMLMETPPLDNFVTPGPMQTLFSLSFGWGGSRADRFDLPEPKEFGVDWMLYTPVTDRMLFLQAADGLALKAWLDTQPQAPRRLHTVPWTSVDSLTLRPLESRFVPFDDPCNRLGRSGPALPFDFSVERSMHDDRPYFLAVFVENDSTGLRAHQSLVEWRVEGASPDGTRQALRTVRGQGFGLVGDSDWADFDFIELDVTLSIVLPEPVSPGVWEHQVMDPSCYGVGEAAMHTRRHRYRYVPATGALVRTDEDS